MIKINDLLKLIIAVITPLAAGTVGSLFTSPALDGWYAGLARPDIAPPNWIFAPAWTALFILMGIAAFLVWRKGLKAKGVKVALILFVAQLALNVIWSVIFFGLRSPGGALIEIAVLWFAIAVTIFFFAKISKPAAWLLAPYILWVSFASYLNYSIYVLN